MDSDFCNKIPFSNLSVVKARKTPYSPYAEFCIKLNGYLVFDKESRELVTRSELFAMMRGDEPQIDEIIKGVHPRFNTFTKIQWESWNQQKDTNDITDH